MIVVDVYSTDHHRARAPVDQRAQVGQAARAEESGRGQGRRSRGAKASLPAEGIKVGRIVRRWGIRQRLSVM
jgi:hypothetical protein